MYTPSPIILLMGFLASLHNTDIKIVVKLANSLCFPMLTLNMFDNS